MPLAATPSRPTAGALPQPAAVLELLKPLTWFPPVWAFGCGIAASGAPPGETWPRAALGLLLAGPAVCAMSQAVNDWFDRHVDALNEPHRPIPSGRIPGRWGLGIALAWTLLSLLLGAALGGWVLAATLVGVALAWAYSAPPLRLKRNGWWGNLACGLCYETLPWVTAVAALGQGAPSLQLCLVALCYGLGAHGIMTLNDFKSVVGDRRFGIASLPVQLGEAKAGLVACLFMGLAQFVVAGLLLGWGAPWTCLLVLLLLAAQVALMPRLLAAPRERAAWYAGTGVTLYVLGMLASAFALRQPWP